MVTPGPLNAGAWHPSQPTVWKTAAPGSGKHDVGAGAVHFVLRRDVVGQAQLVAERVAHELDEGRLVRLPTEATDAAVGEDVRVALDGRRLVRLVLERSEER